MASWYEFLGEKTDPQSVGRIHLNTDYVSLRKPLWFILVKLAALACMVALGYLIAMPCFSLGFWQSTVLVAGLMMLYIGAAFFFRPEPDGDNMGWIGGAVDDPFHFSDDMNRALWKLHCFLGPGRFAAETILDIGTWLGFTREVTGEEIEAEAAEKQRARSDEQREQWQKEALQRIEARREEKPGGQLELSSARFFGSDQYPD